MKEARDKEIITKQVYRNVYMKAKGGFFRSIRHLKMYMNEHALFTKKE
jgi:ribosomal protein L19E